MHKTSNISRNSKIIIFICLAVINLTACQSVKPPHGAGMFSNQNHGHDDTDTWSPEKPEAYQTPTAMSLKDMPDFDGVIKSLLEKPIVFIGESHDRISHHLNQLEIIKRIYATDPDMVIGMEFFQTPFQAHMDEYINGSINEREFLQKTEYYNRWRIDYRHYRPIIQFAKKNSIPLLALDVLEEIQRKVGKTGVNSLDQQEQKHLPDMIDRSNQDYREFLQSIYNRHPRSDGQSFDNFIDVQLMRDEVMAQTATTYMKKHPKKRMIVLAGGGHIIYGYGIPQRMARRLGHNNMSIVLNGFMTKPSPDLADFVLLPEPLKLPKAGLLGVIMDKPNTAVQIKDFSANSGARLAGAKKEDHFVSIDGQNIQHMGDVKFSLLDKQPGDKVKLVLRRKNWIGDDKEIDIEVVLQ